jgi:hypothetical protein
MLSRRLAVPFLVAAAGVLLAGCAGPTPAPGGDGGDGGDQPVPAVDLPGWYGTDLDANGCPVPAAGAEIEAFAGFGEFAQAEVPAGWCAYTHTSYTQHFAIPADPSADFASEVRSALEPAGWEFDAADDDSPQWSWINAYPAGAEEGFDDGAVDGAIFTVDAATADDIETYEIWFTGLPAAFGGDWAEGDPIKVVGFW